jgi:hypothetical protein
MLSGVGSTDQLERKDERLIRLLNALGQDVEIIVRSRPAKPPRNHHPFRVVAMEG